MDHSRPKWTEIERKGHKGPKQTEKDRNGKKWISWTEVDENGPIRSQQTERTIIDRSGPKQTKLD